MSDNFEDRDFQTRYLLRTADERAAARFEDAYFADDRLFEQLNIAEDELVDDYVRGTLAALERQQFEAAFLEDAPRRRKVEIARQLFKAANVAGSPEAPRVVAAEAASDAAKKSSEKSGEPVTAGWRRKFQALFRAPRLAAGFAALLILAGGAFLVWRAIRSRNDELAARQPTPSPVAVNSSPNVSTNPSPPPLNENGDADQTDGTNRTDAANRNGAANQTNAAPAKTVAPETAVPRPTPAPTFAPPPRQPTVAVLALAAGGVRSEGSASRLRLAPEIDFVRLELDFAAGEYKNYAAVVSRVGAAEIYRARAARRKNHVVVEVPARRLAPGDYIVALTGANKSGAAETIDEYFFTVVK